MFALFAILALALRLPLPDGEEAAQTQHWRSIAIPVAVAAALWLEPIATTLGYGQINLLIALLVVGDLSRPDGARGKGALIGIAAGLKLTPLIFIPYLRFSGRPRPARMALGTFAATVIGGYAILPGDSSHFWADGLFLNPRRVGGCCVPDNQSLRGLVLRLDPSFGNLRLLGIAMIVALSGLALAVLASRRGDEAAGFSVCGLTALLVSPVSWTHHWTLAVPALLLLGARVVRRHSTVGITAAAAILLVGYSYLPKLLTKPDFAPRHRPPLAWTLAAAPYILIALLALVATGAYEIRRAAAALPPRRPRPGGGTPYPQSHAT
jgi:alpha-1,2-mannosyltransferase